MSVTETSGAIMFYSAVAMMIGGLFSLPFGWATPTGWEWTLLAATGVIQFAGHFLAIEAFRLAEAAIVSPFKYTTLLWAAAWGYMLWGDVPAWNIWIGAGIVVASTLFIYRVVVPAKT
ncbi:MAG: DMT family transporter, partial [Acetobacterales bacterium]